MRKENLVERSLHFAGQAFAPMAAVRAAHRAPKADKSFDRPWEKPSEPAPFPPTDVNAYDEYIGQLKQAHPELDPYVDTLYDMVQTPNDIERGLGMVALILDRDNHPV